MVIVSASTVARFPMLIVSQFALLQISTEVAFVLPSCIAPAAFVSIPLDGATVMLPVASTSKFV